MSTIHYLENQFLNVTKRNRKLAVIISNDHDSKLFAHSSDPDIMELFDRFHPTKTALSINYAGWTATKGVYKGETTRMNNKLKELTSKSEDWDVQIQLVYKQGTPDYVAILPNRR